MKLDLMINDEDQSEESKAYVAAHRDERRFLQAQKPSI